MRWLDDGLQENLRQRGMLTTTRTQSLIFGNISLGETRPSRLAKNVGISPQAMSQVLAELVAAGLVELVLDATDKRARVVQLTQAGHDYLTAVREIYFSMEKALEQRFGRAVIDVVRMVVETHWGEPILVEKVPALNVAVPRAEKTRKAG